MWGGGGEGAFCALGALPEAKLPADLLEPDGVCVCGVLTMLKAASSGSWVCP